MKQRSDRVERSDHKKYQQMFDLKRLFLLFPAVILAAALPAQTAHKYLREADKAFRQNDLPKAEENYRKAQEQESTDRTTYNLGTTLAEQERYQEAIAQLEAAAEGGSDPKVRSRAFYNLGNAHFAEGARNKEDQKAAAEHLQKAIESYKNALRLQPSDRDTKNNLELAQQMYRLLQPPPQQDQQQQDQQNQEQEEQEQEQQQQQSGDQEEEQQEQEEQQQQQQAQDQQEAQAGEASEELSEEEARQLLEIMEREEQKVIEKLRKRNQEGRPPVKDW